MSFCKLFYCLTVSLFVIHTKGDCPNGQFQCKSDSKCIDQKLKCSGTNDCADASDEMNCPSGCAINGTTVAQNTTGQDMEWWYVCTNAKWVIGGCVVHGHRFKADEIYRMFTTEGIFWGKCQQLSNGFFMRQPLGCVDVRGKNINPGETFMINDVFWGTCQLTTNTTTVPDLGPIALNEVSWKVTGCNNGSLTPLKEGEEFPWIFDPYVVLGVKVKCKLPSKAKEMPALNPTACIVGVNSSSKWEVRILKDHCYMAADDLIFFCAIMFHPFASKTDHGQSQADAKRFTLNITENSPNEIQRLTASNYHACFEKDQALTDLANAPKPPRPQQPVAPPNPQQPPTGPQTNPQLPPTGPQPNPQQPPTGPQPNPQVPPAAPQPNPQQTPGRKKRSLMTEANFEKLHTKFSGVVRAMNSKMTDFDTKKLFIHHF